MPLWTTCRRLYRTTQRSEYKYDIILISAHGAYFTPYSYTSNWQEFLKEKDIQKKKQNPRQTLFTTFNYNLNLRTYFFPRKMMNLR